MNRLSGMTTKVTLDRFVRHCIEYMEATVEEAALRERRELSSLEDYCRIRQDNGGVKPCFDLIEVALGVSLPDTVFDDPNFVQVFHAAVDMICWSNVGIHSITFIDCMLSW